MTEIPASREVTRETLARDGWAFAPPDIRYIASRDPGGGETLFWAVRASELDAVLADMADADGVNLTEVALAMPPQAERSIRDQFAAMPGKNAIIQLSPPERTRP